MGLDMYLKCNSEGLCKDLNDFSVERGWIPSAWTHQVVYGTAVYWRKCNAIHKWFVDHVQDGEDDCGYYRVSLEELHQLAEDCKTVLDSVELVPGRIDNGWSADKNGVHEEYLDCKVMKDTSVAEKVLPCVDGFFFGNVNYSEHYVADLQYTYDALLYLFSRLKDVEVDGMVFPITVHESQPEWDVEFTYHSSW